MFGAWQAQAWDHCTYYFLVIPLLAGCWDFFVVEQIFLDLRCLSKILTPAVPSCSTPCVTCLGTVSALDPANHPGQVLTCPRPGVCSSSWTFLSCLSPASKTLAPVFLCWTFFYLHSSWPPSPRSQSAQTALFPPHHPQVPWSWPHHFPPEQYLFPSAKPEDVLFWRNKVSVPSRQGRGERVGTWHPGPECSSLPLSFV